MTDQPAALPMELVLKHDSRSIVGSIVPSQDLTSHRFAFQIEGEASPRYLNLPKKLIAAPLVKGVQTIVTITITQCGLMPQFPTGGLNGHTLGEG